MSPANEPKASWIKAVFDTEKMTLGQLLSFFFALATLGFVSMLIFASRSETSYSQVLGSGLFLAGAASMVGAFVGLLFGIPKLGPADPSDQEAAGTREQKKLAYNTNLSDISDWLTKALVGASLVEIREIGDALVSFFTAAGPAFSTDPNIGALVAGSIAIHYAIAGFFCGYFYASVVLRKVIQP